MTKGAIRSDFPPDPSPETKRPPKGATVSAKVDQHAPLSSVGLVCLCGKAWASIEGVARTCACGRTWIVTAMLIGGDDAR